MRALHSLLAPLVLQFLACFTCQGPEARSLNREREKIQKRDISCSLLGLVLARRREAMGWQGWFGFNYLGLRDIPSCSMIPENICSPSQLLTRIVEYIFILSVHVLITESTDSY